MTKKKTTYSSILYPLKDIYELAGRDAFSECEREEEKGKNLIIITSQINKRSAGEGGLDALRFLSESSDLIESNNDGITIYNLFGGLDVAYISNETIDEGNIKDIIAKNDWTSKKPTTIISQDVSQTLRYRSHGFNCEQPGFLIPEEGIVNKGIILGNSELHAELYEKKNRVPLEDAMIMLEEENLHHNQFIKFLTGSGYDYAKISGEIQRNKRGDRIIEIKDPFVKLLSPDEYAKIYKIGHQKKGNIFGITPRDIEQYLAVQHGILNPDVELSFICGSQGSGKTLLTYTAAVDLILNYEKEIAKLRNTPRGQSSFFKKIVLLKPNNTMGGSDRGVGYLPGSLWQKEKPHLEPFIDAHKESTLDCIPFLDMILHPKRKNDFGIERDKKTSSHKFNKEAYLPMNTEAIEVGSSGFLRGRTFTDTLLLIDEAQNFTPYELKTIIARMGPNSKCVIMGDPDQFDNPLCSKNINGLTAGIKQFLPKPQTSLIKLSNNYRSQSSHDTLEWRAFSDS